MMIIYQLIYIKNTLLQSAGEATESPQSEDSYKNPHEDHFRKSLLPTVIYNHARQSHFQFALEDVLLDYRSLEVMAISYISQIITLYFMQVNVVI